ncbi:NUDIX domain-containing protein [Paracoccus sp. (in: a-proteobacteria)]|uniref:NUDIX domain-containing protein n=1 Tax=Paracoccus sp. TaxID=267 RepID=UPI0026DEE537|nr:NUDIX domain-containing protein [Paracoccus sp. (in: a-proteobacteria)]MDO5646379.1 NUDIX domain-containing protein [Paracoccus sp. (in: a-proteobacteria)]
MTIDPKQQIRNAATIILLRRQPEGVSVLMGMRGAAAAFMPSKFVFPGGAVDADDGDLPLSRPLAQVHRDRLLTEQRGDHPINPDAVAAAALRELAEETGLLIGQPSDAPAHCAGYQNSGLAPDASALSFVFRAITPPGRPRRFDAFFFAADAARLSVDADDFSRACDELSHLHWVPLADARALNLPFITEVVLAELAQLVAGVPHDAALPVPATVPFFDNRTEQPRFAQIS